MKIIGDKITVNKIGVQCGILLTRCGEVLRNADNSVAEGVLDDGATNEQ